MELQSNWFPSPTFPVDSYAKVGDLIMFDDAMPKFSPNVFNGFGTHKVVGCPPHKDPRSSQAHIVQTLP